MSSITVSSPAKINLFLEILSKRADGYHNIQTVFQKISLCDEVRIRVSDRQGITVTCSAPDIPSGADNLAYRAADLLLKKYRLQTGVSIEIEKNIPAGAGLGGGSSNAAATLMGLDRMFELNMDTADYIDLSLNIGADVAFFTMNSATALASGTGETLHPFTLNIPVWIAVIFPGFGVSTAWAYKTYSRKYNLLTKHKKNSILNSSINTIEQLVSILHNDFEEIVWDAHPEIKTLKQRLVETGARGALMSGSGSSVFGVFDSRHQAEQCLEQLLSENSNWKGFVARAVPC